MALLETGSRGGVGQMGLADTAGSPQVQIVARAIEALGGLKCDPISGIDAESVEGELPVRLLAPKKAMRSLRSA